MFRSSTRRLVGGAAALMLLGATLFGSAGTALATVPAGSATNEALPPTVTGNVVAFRTNLYYSDTSTLSKAFVTLFTTGTSDVLYVAATKNGVAVANACGSTLPISCTFKTVRTNDHLAVTVAYTRIASPATGDGVWSSTGAPTSDGGTSHGDTWQDPNGPATATFDPNAPDYGGGFSTTAGASIEDFQVVSKTNPQATRLANLPAGVAGTVADGNSANQNQSCGPFDCTNAIGEWSDIHVGDGQTFTTAFQIVITIYQGTPKSFVHSYVDSNGVTQFEQIFPCPKKNLTAAIPCFTWTANLNQATIYTYHNGSVRGL